MTKIPSIADEKVIRALQRDGWVVVRQKGSHIRLQKRTHNEVLKLTIPTHRPIKRSTLSSDTSIPALSLCAFCAFLRQFFSDFSAPPRVLRETPLWFLIGLSSIERQWEPTAVPVRGTPMPVAWETAMPPSRWRWRPGPVPAAGKSRQC